MLASSTHLMTSVLPSSSLAIPPSSQAESFSRSPPSSSSDETSLSPLQSVRSRSRENYISVAYNSGEGRPQDMEVSHQISASEHEAANALMQANRQQEQGQPMQIDPAAALAANSILSLIQTNPQHQQILQQLHTHHLSTATNGALPNVQNEQRFHSPSTTTAYANLSQAYVSTRAADDKPVRTEARHEDIDVEMKPLPGIKVLRQDLTVPPTGEIQEPTYKSLSALSVAQTTPIHLPVQQRNGLSASQGPAALPPLTSLSNDAALTQIMQYETQTNNLIASGRYRLKKEENMEVHNPINEMGPLHFVNGAFTTPSNISTNEIIQTTVSMDAQDPQHGLPPPIYVQMQNGSIQALPSSAAAAQLAINNIATLPQAFYHPSQIKTLPEEENNHMIFQNGTNNFGSHLVNDENPMATMTSGMNGHAKSEGRRGHGSSRQCM